MPLTSDPKITQSVHIDNATNQGLTTTKIFRHDTASIINDLTSAIAHFKIFSSRHIDTTNVRGNNVTGIKNSVCSVLHLIHLITHPRFRILGSPDNFCTIQSKPPCCFWVAALGTNQGSNVPNFCLGNRIEYVEQFFRIISIFLKVPIPDIAGRRIGFSLVERCLDVFMDYFTIGVDNKSDVEYAVFHDFRGFGNHLSNQVDVKLFAYLT